MIHTKESPAARRGVPEVSLAACKIDPEISLNTLRAQYLADIFALPADTAITIAELAFGGDR
jgi:hypothetical protein